MAPSEAEAASPPRRPFVKLDAENGDGPTIRVVSYNILADGYAPASSFPDTPPADLAWAARQPRLLDEILAYDADVLCLQEVQQDVWEESEDDTALIPSLRAAGYEGAWFWAAGQTSLAPKPPLVGPALLWRAARFSATAVSSITLRDAADELAGGHAPTAALLAGSRDGAVAAVLVGAGPATAPPILACSAHLNWDPRTPDLKVLQAASLCRHLERVAGSCCAGDGGAVSSPLPPLILAGDLNSPAVDAAANAAPGAPSCEGEPAGAVVLLSTGACPPGHPHHPARQRGGVAAPLTTGRWGALTSVRAAAGGEPALTTRRSGFEATLDYIFVTGGDWRVRAVLADPWWGEGDGRGGGPPPPPPPVEEFGAMPNGAWPSDHAAVGAELELNADGK